MHQMSRRGLLGLAAGAGVWALAGCRQPTGGGATGLADAARALRAASYRFVLGNGDGGYFREMASGTYDPGRGVSVRVAAFRDESDSVWVRALAVGGQLYMRVDGQRYDHWRVRPAVWYSVAPQLLNPGPPGDLLRALTAVPGDPSSAGAILEHVTDPGTGTPLPVTSPGDSDFPTPVATAGTRVVAGPLDAGVLARSPVLTFLNFSTTPRGSGPTPIGPVSQPPAAFECAAELTGDGRLARLFVWENGEIYWTSIVITGYGDVAADLSAPDPATVRQAVEDDVVELMYGLTV